MVEMTPAEVTTILRQFNGWRRDFDDKFEQPDPHEVSEAIDAAVEMIERLEAAEKSDAESIAMYRKARDERDALRAKIEAAEKERDNANAASVNIALEAERLQCENDALRAKITETKKQEPVRHEFQGRDGDWYPFINQRHYENTVADGTWPIRALYALPGAKGE